ncbi:MAG: fasciclin domain-containing protein [Prevotella sp.]|nr:fasciclin domain-containing protein [Prevotella sp.]
MMKRYSIFNKVIGLALVALTFMACSDTWDEHYDQQSEGMNDASLWQAITQNSNLSNFAKVVQACGYDKALNSSQVFTVFAPTNDNFTAQEADELIAAYNAEKGKVNEDDNTVIKEFIQNHIAMYNHSLTETSNDSLVMMNGKYAKLAPGAFGNSKMLTSNQHYNNGILFTIDRKAQYFPNVFEYLRKDADLDSVRSFFYNPRFYRKEFIPGRSVAGGLEDGKTVYLDSVFVQQNDLFEYNFLEAELNTEDSTYWMVVPTNKEWKRLIEEYEPYFNYDDQVRFRDSLSYTNARLAIMAGTTFSRTLNTDAHLTDSALSTIAVERYESRKYNWGDNNLHYYQFGGRSNVNTQKPFGSEGIFNGTENIQCSNGQVMKTDNWKINKLNTFYQWIIIEAEEQGSIQEVSKSENTISHEMEPTVSPITRRIMNNNRFYGKIWDDAFVEFEQLKPTTNHSVLFNIRNVLSNIGYDIYLVTAPALANDSNATEVQRLPSKLKCTINFHDQQGEPQKQLLQNNIVTTSDEVNYLLLAEDFKFPCATWGLTEAEPQVSLLVETNVTPREQSIKKYTRTLMIDCIMLVPHGISTVDEERFTVSPHGDGDTYYWLKKY